MSVADDQRTVDLLRQRLQRAINRVPDRIQSGSIQATRDWMARREEAAKLLKKGGTATELLSALSQIE